MAQSREASWLSLTVSFPGSALAARTAWSRWRHRLALAVLLQGDPSATHQGRFGEGCLSKVHTARNGVNGGLGPQQRVGTPTTALGRREPHLGQQGARAWHPMGARWGRMNEQHTTGSIYIFIE